MFGQPLRFAYWLPEHPVFWFPSCFSQHSQLDCLWLPIFDCAAPVPLTGCHATSLVTKCFSPNPLPREADDFPKGSNDSKHVPLLTYLAWLQPICYNSQIYIYTDQDWKSSDCGEDFNRKHRAATTLISSHESGNKNSCFLKKYISEQGCISKLVPQKLHFKTWMLKDSDRWLLPEKLSYIYYQKGMLRAAEILLIHFYSKNMWSLLVHPNHYKKKILRFSFSPSIRMLN